MTTTGQTVPFFVFGAQRSGTTLLRLMLAAHPRLIVPPESHFIPDLARIERWAGSLDGHRDRIADWLIADPRLADFGLDPAWLRGTVRTLHPLTTASVTRAIFDEYAARHGRERWGDKTPRYRNFVPELYRVFPEARFVHVVRDGRDSAQSVLKAGMSSRRNLIGASYLWRDSVSAAWRGRRAVPDGSFLEVRYETLLREPAKTLAQVCDFIGESFDPAMLDFYKNADDLVPSWEKGWHSKLSTPLDPRNADKWKKTLSSEQVQTFERIAGRELRRAGYELVGKSMPVRLFLDVQWKRAQYLTRAARNRTYRRVLNVVLDPFHDAIRVR